MDPQACYTFVSCMIQLIWIHIHPFVSHGVKYFTVCQTGLRHSFGDDDQTTRSTESGCCKKKCKGQPASSF